MSSLTVKLGILAAGLMLSGCMQATTYEATNQTNFKPRDKELLAKVRYVNTPVAEPFRRAIVDYHRKEAPGSIVVDSDNHYLYFVLNDGKAIRYEGVIGPVSFDQYGDITGPFRLWKIADGKVATFGEMSTDDVNALKAKIGK